jgi:hypothetical protein
VLPSSVPSGRPTSTPTSTPSGNPTFQPTSNPTSAPIATSPPTSSPIAHPTAAPAQPTSPPFLAVTSASSSSSGTLVYIIAIIILVVLLVTGATCVIVWWKRQQHKDRALSRADDGSRRGSAGRRGDGGVMTTNPMFEESTRENTLPLQPSEPVTVYKQTSPMRGPIHLVQAHASAQPGGRAAAHQSRPTTVFDSEDIHVSAHQGVSSKQYESYRLPTVPGNIVTMPAPGEYGRINTQATYAAPVSSRAPVGGGGLNVYSHLERDASTTVAFPPPDEYASLNTSTTYATPVVARASDGPNIYSHTGRGNKRATSA